MEELLLKNYGYWPSLCPLNRDTVFLSGGQDKNATGKKNCYAYNILTDSLEPKADMNNGRAYHSQVKVS